MEGRPHRFVMQRRPLEMTANMFSMNYYCYWISLPASVSKNQDFLDLNFMDLCDDKKMFRNQLAVKKL